MSEVLRAAIDRLRIAGRAETAALEEITIGPRAMLVELREGDGATAAGLAHRPPGDPPERADRDVTALLSAATDSGAESIRSDRALGIATANALSASQIDWRRGDPMALLDPDVERITTVGLFGPAFRKFDGVEVRVVERDPVGEPPDPPGVDVRTFTPDAADAAMASAEVVFVTGSAFVYGGVDRYLDAAPDEATVVVIGATASFLPEPLFDAGVDVVAGASVSDVASVRAGVSDGACGTDLHDNGVEKVYVAASQPAGVQLETTNTTETTDGGRYDL
jgi:uncharacterized protein (DUF4213/DUF364 family)